MKKVTVPMSSTAASKRLDTDEIAEHHEKRRLEPLSNRTGEQVQNDQPAHY